jgi:hypothetical protein
VPADTEIAFRYGGQNPPKMVKVGAYDLKKLQETGTVRPSSSLKAHGPEVQRTIPAELSPGEHVLEVFVKERQGDTSYYSRIMAK